MFSVPVEFANCYGLPFCACFSTCLVACGFFGVLFLFCVDFVHVGMPYEVFLLLHACWLCFTMNVFPFSKPEILFGFLCSWLLMDVFLWCNKFHYACVTLQVLMMSQ